MLMFMTKLLLVVGGKSAAIAASASPSCPQRCQCAHIDGRMTTNCDRLGLTTLPSDAAIPSSTMSLILTNNNFVDELAAPAYFRRRNAHNVVWLFLAHSNVTAVHPDTFSGLANLQKLDLSYNRLTVLPPLAFRDLAKLDYLLMQHNRLTELSARQFAGMSQLREIDLSHNHIYYLHPDTFNGLFKLRKINLRHNRLQITETAVFDWLVSDSGPLLLLHLDDNPWHCDCRLRQLRDWYEAKHVGEPPVCRSPPRYANKNWRQMQSDEFACPPTFGATAVRHSAAPGDTVTLRCPVAGDPRPTVVWQFLAPNSTGAARQMTNSSRRRVDDAGVGDDHSLTIQTFSKRDVGSYLCIAENAADKQVLLFHVTRGDGGGANGDTNDSGSRTRLTLDTQSTAYDFERLPVEALVGLASLIAVVVTMAVCLLVVCRQRSNERKRRSAADYSSANGNHHHYQMVDGDTAAASVFVDAYDDDDGGLAAADAIRHGAGGTHLRVTFDDGGFGGAGSGNGALETDDSGYLDSSEPSPHGALVSAHSYRPTPPSSTVRFAGVTAVDRSLLAPVSATTEKAPLAELFEDRETDYPLKETSL